MYEHTIGVPLVLAGPGIPKGQRRDAQVYLRELYPTLCELVDVAIPNTVEGSSFVTILRDPGKLVHESTFAYFEDAQRMIRGARWKLIRYPKVQKEQLFDLAHDSFETKNLADEPRHAALIARLRAELEAWQDQVGDPIRSPRTQPE
jgi:arylsulfatase A-like enzyme